MKILVVDPSASYREVIKAILITEDVSIMEVGSGTEALALLKTEVPDAISVAHELKDMDSFQLLKRMNRNQILENVPKFLLTSNASQSFKREAYNVGFTEIFIKADFQVLKRALRSLMTAATTNISANVLYIEDTRSAAEYTIHIMKKAGWNVHHVTNGEDAAALLDKYKNRFDLVITDLVLEGRLSGIGLINLIRQGNESIRNLPILAVSGWNDLLRQVYVLRHGAGDFIAKPFHETDFLARAINLILNKKAHDKIKAAQKALYLKANLDALTGLNNRHYVEEFGHKMVESAIVSNQGVAMIVVDIDQFKQVNDSRGHASGDIVLRKVSTLIRALCDSNDLVVRIGGDEILIVMTDCHYDEAKVRAESLRSQIELLKPENTVVTASIGVAIHDQKVAIELVELLQKVNSLEDDKVSLNYDTLFKAADHCLYEAKRAGRNRVCINNLMESKPLAKLHDDG